MSFSKSFSKGVPQLSNPLSPRPPPRARTGSRGSGALPGLHATRAGAFSGECAHGVGRYAGVAVRKDDHHRLNLTFGQKVVDNVIRVAGFRPFPVVAADAVQQNEHRVLTIGRIAWRRVDAHLATRSE